MEFWLAKRKLPMENFRLENEKEEEYGQKINRTER